MARSIGATIPANLAGWTDSLNKFDLKLQTINDDKTITLNSREFSQTSGTSAGFSSTPNQIVASTGTLTGGTIAPTVASGISQTTLVGLTIAPVMAGTGAGDITNTQGLVINLADGGANTRNLIGDVAWLRVVSNLKPAAVSGQVSVVQVVGVAGSTDHTQFVTFDSSSAIATATGTAALPANTGFVRVRVAGSNYKIPLYAG